jgi:hypothetical protein
MWCLLGVANKIILPRLFEWYSKDFGISPSKPTETIQALKFLLPDEFKIDLFKLDEKKLTIKFSSYNWKPAFNIDPYILFQLQLSSFPFFLLKKVNIRK